MNLLSAAAHSYIYKQVTAYHFVANEASILSNEPLCIYLKGMHQVHLLLLSLYYFCELVNDTKNNKDNSFNQAIDTTAVLGRQSHFGPAAVLSLVLSTPPYHSVLALL